MSWIWEVKAFNDMIKISLKQAIAGDEVSPSFPVDLFSK